MSSSIADDRPLDASTSEALTELALDLRWSFNHSADQLWERLDPELWELTHNPWVLLQTVSREKLQTVTSDPGFQKLLADLHREKLLAEESEAWFQKAHPRLGRLDNCLFLDGVHAERSAANLFRRTRQRRRRSAQSRKQPGRPGYRNWVALPTRVFSAGN